MSASSGIGVTPELAEAFAAAIESNSVRALKVSIRNESLIHDGSIDVHGSFEDDLESLQEILQDDVPAYLLVKHDEPSLEWLMVYYVPDSAKVRDKMLHASSRHNLLRSLGSAPFTDSIFATSKNDLTPRAYDLHKQASAAPQPMSVQEQELADIKAAERDAGSGYDGSGLKTHFPGAVIGFDWSSELIDAVKALGAGDQSRLIVIDIDTSSETLRLVSGSDTTADGLGSVIPPTTPSYSFFAWPHSYTSPPRREIVFIYSCPSQSPIKGRMVYASGANGVYQTAKMLLESSGSILAPRKLETSHPKEMDEAHLKIALGYGQSNAGTSVSLPEKKPFARPKGPGRKR